MNASSRKMEEDLAERDFKSSPVWRLCTNVDDGEVPFEPCQQASVSLGQRGAYLIAAKAVLANGTECTGFVQVARMLSFVEEGPLTLFLNGRQCPIEASIPGWAGTKAVSDAEKAMLPIRWTATVSLANEPKPRAGSVSGSRLVHFFKSTIRGLRIDGAQ